MLERPKRFFMSCALNSRQAILCTVQTSPPSRGLIVPMMHFFGLTMGLLPTFI